MAAQDFGQTFIGKALILVVMTFNAVLVVLLIRYTRVHDGPMYFTSTAVVMTEFLKLCVTTIVLTFWDYGGNLKDLATGFNQHILTNKVETLKMAVPSLVYAVQNNLSYIALSNLDAATFQVTYQLKIVTTAVLMYYLMRKDLSVRQWISVIVLTCGVALVNLEKVDSGSKTINGTSTKSPDTAQYNYPVGLAAIIAACFCSGFAGVYFEKLLKGSGAKSEASLWMKNFQMYFFSTPLAFVVLLLKEGEEVFSKGFYYGYNNSVCFLLGFQVLGGLVVSLVMKYTDNIVKNFATAISILLAAVGSYLVFGTYIGGFFFIGLILVIGATYTYNANPPPKPKAPTTVGV